ncbi:unnamed protein product, partial [Symbiodinium sp. CCMP2456]
MDRVENAANEAFSTAVDTLLDRTENVIQVHHTTTVDADALKELISMMAWKIQLQDHELERQGEALRALGSEVQRLRTEADASAGLRNDVRRLHQETEELKSTVARQASALDALRHEHDDMHLDISRAVAGAHPVASSSSGAPPAHAYTEPTSLGQHSDTSAGDYTASGAGTGSVRFDERQQNASGSLLYASPPGTAGGAARRRPASSDGSDAF